MPVSYVPLGLSFIFLIAIGTAFGKWLWHTQRIGSNWKPLLGAFTYVLLLVFWFGVWFLLEVIFDRLTYGPPK